MITPLQAIENAALLIEDGIISAVGARDRARHSSQREVIDFGDAVLAPGLIDIHIHGGAGHDVMEGSDASLAAVERLMTKHGVTSYCPTTVTAPIDHDLAFTRCAGKSLGECRRR